MQISEIGGEFELIKRITRPDGALVGVGDDAAAIDVGAEELLLVTCDMLCEGDHFNLEWSTPKKIGRKCMESNVSDIAAMGGVPTHAFIALSLKPGISFEFMQKMYEGVYDACEKHGFYVVGGDTTHGASLVVSVTLLGRVKREHMRLRSGAKAGQLICVTGDLGKSMAGLKLLERGLEGDTRAHLNPRCRLVESRAIAPFCSSMIDVSDGLASEVSHICRASGIGAIIEKNRIPISDSTRQSAKKLGMDPHEMALCGGEDFELVFTVDPELLGQIRTQCPITVIGETVSEKEGVLISIDGKTALLKGGFDHFK